MFINRLQQVWLLVYLNISPYLPLPPPEIWHCFTTSYYLETGLFPNTICVVCPIQNNSSSLYLSYLKLPTIHSQRVSTVHLRVTVGLCKKIYLNSQVNSGFWLYPFPRLFEQFMLLLWLFNVTHYNEVRTQFHTQWLNCSPLVKSHHEIVCLECFHIILSLLDAYVIDANKE